MPSSKVGLVRLDNVATLTEDKGPSQIDRFNREALASLATAAVAWRFGNLPLAMTIGVAVVLALRHLLG